MKDHQIDGITDVFTTTDLLESTKNKKLPKADLTVIMIGTNDIRLGMTATAIRNVSKLEEAMKTRNTLMAHIPPMEMGNQGSDHCEETKIDRGIFNHTITDKFHQYVK